MPICVSLLELNGQSLKHGLRVGSTLVVIKWWANTKIAIARVITPVCPAIRMHYPLSFKTFRQTVERPDEIHASAASVPSDVAVFADLILAFRDAAFQTASSLCRAATQIARVA